jgi:hypothetical protein
MKWITRSHVHVDRVACPWLISRFIDSEAAFLFAPKTQVLEQAAKEVYDALYAWCRLDVAKSAA